jgi:UDP-glucuronate 4-epimerase
MERDFTYIDDIVSGVTNVLAKGSQDECHTIFNIGRGEPMKLMEFLAALEKEFGKRTEYVFEGMQNGDVKRTFSDVSKLTEHTGYKPAVSVNLGVKRFVSWYKEYFNFRETHD